jgi:type VI protein secretion system component VasK
MPERPPPGPKTVVRPPPRPAAAAPDAGVLAGLARPLLDLSRSASRVPEAEAPRLAAEARRAVEDFEREGRRAGLPAADVIEARNALVALLRVRGLGNPALPPGAWARILEAALPLGAAVLPETLARQAEAAARAGPARRELARFLAHCFEAVEAARPAEERRAQGTGRGWIALALALVVLALAGWAGWAEWQYRERLLATLPVLATEAPGMSLESRARALDSMASAVAAVEAAAPASPLGLVARLPFADPARVAQDRHAQLADALIPGPLSEALALSLATEGDADALYDTLRAWSILGGETDWQTGFLAGWIAARPALGPGLLALAPHVSVLSGPVPDALAGALDPETLAQARTFAAEGTPAARAYLELERSDPARALALWTPATELPQLAPVLIRRSGLPLTEGIPGLFTRAGWTLASDGGAAAATARADAESARLFGSAAPADPAEVLDRLQDRTLDAWSTYLSDLRVRPFADQPGAVLVSGLLAVRDSPLAALVRAVWRETGGEDRSRSHANQLAVAASFGPAIQFVETGGMAEISQLFAALNVALAALDADADLGLERLMDVQARAVSIATLNQAPVLVVQIIEDVLAQSTASTEGRFQTRWAAHWRSRLAPACTATIDGRFPFAEGPDADLAAVADLLAPGGALPTFFAEMLAPVMDTSESPWRWKPEGRMSGLTPESAAFFERVQALGGALFPEAAVAETGLTFTALAQRGAATVSLGGARAPVTVSGEPVELNWPGPDPAEGFEIAFETGAGVERQAEPGPWGLLRFLDGLRLRPREDGRRYLIDARLGTTRAYLQLDFERAANPITARPLMRGLACPPAL